MHTIGISCDKIVSGELIEGGLIMAPPHYRLKPVVYSSTLSLVGDFNSSLVQGLVFGLHEFTNRHFEILSVIKSKTPLLPLVVMCTRIVEADCAKLAGYKNTTVLMYPSELASLPGVFYKMFNHRKVSPRQHVRRNVCVQAQLKNKGSDYSCTLRNLSKAGACGEINGQRVQPGDKVVVRIPLSGPARQFNVHANVVWTREFAPNNMHRTRYQQVGFQF